MTAHAIGSPWPGGALEAPCNTTATPPASAAAPSPPAHQPAARPRPDRTQNKREAPSQAPCNRLWPILLSFDQQCRLLLVLQGVLSSGGAAGAPLGTGAAGGALGCGGARAAAACKRVRQEAPAAGRARHGVGFVGARAAQGGPARERARGAPACARALLAWVHWREVGRGRPCWGCDRIWVARGSGRGAPARVGHDGPQQSGVPGAGRCAAPLGRRPSARRGSTRPGAACSREVHGGPGAGAVARRQMRCGWGRRRSGGGLGALGRREGQGERGEGGG
jgi:hypothetical protein